MKIHKKLKIGKWLGPAYWWVRCEKYQDFPHVHPIHSNELLLYISFIYVFIVAIIKHLFK